MTETEARILAERLTSARCLRGLTQQELARRSGVPQPQISRLERGQVAEPSVFAVSRLARALDVDLRLLVEPDAERFLRALIGEGNGEPLVSAEELACAPEPLALRPDPRILEGRGAAVALGRLDDGSELRLPLGIADEHLLIAGDAGSGSEEALLRLLAPLARERGGLLLLDAHGTVSGRALAVLAEAAGERGREALLADLADPTGALSLNLLDVADERAAHGTARAATEILFADATPHHRSRQLALHGLVALCEANLRLAAAGSEERFTLFDLPELLLEPELRAMVAALSSSPSVLHLFDPEWGAFTLSSDAEQQRQAEPVIAALEQLGQSSAACFCLSGPYNLLPGELAGGGIVVARLAGRSHEGRGGEMLAALIAATLPHHLRAQEGRDPVRLAITSADAVMRTEPALALVEERHDPEVRVVCLAERLSRNGRQAERLLAAFGSVLAFTVRPGDAGRLAAAISPGGEPRGEDIFLQQAGSFYGQVRARDEDGRLIASGPFHAALEHGRREEAPPRVRKKAEAAAKTRLSAKRRGRRRLDEIMRRLHEILADEIGERA